MQNDFEIGMKVTLDGEKGLVVRSPSKGDDDVTGWILWDTPKPNDVEDWRGLWGTFKQSGGEVLPPETKFSYIN